LSFGDLLLFFCYEEIKGGLWMSRRTKEFVIETDGGKLEVKLYEVRPRDLYSKLQACVGKKSLQSEEYQELLNICCNLTTDQLAELYPSEMEIILKHFKEVNASFLAPWPTLKKLIEKVGLTEWVLTVVKDAGIKEVFAKALVMDWKKIANTSLEKGTLMPGTTDGDSLKRP
jgi:hypothetical protein